jgi:H+-transporting ATPase
MTVTATHSTKAASTASDPDLEKLPVEQVLTSLHVQPDHGLSQAEVQKRLSQYGPNAIVEKEQSLLAKVAGYFMGPIAYMIEAAAVVSAFLGRWDDFSVIAGLPIFNAGLEFWQDRKASSALEALKGSLAPSAMHRKRCSRSATS